MSTNILKLCEACREGFDWEVETILLEEDVDINSTDHSGWTRLHHAMRHNHPTTLTILLARPETKLDVTHS